MARPRLAPLLLLVAAALVPGPADAAPAQQASTDIPRGPFATITELCAAVDKVVVPRLRARWGEDAFPENVRCTKGDQYGLEPAMSKGGPFEAAVFIDVDDLEQHHTSLAVKTPKGWFRTDVHVASRGHMDTGCMDAVRDRVEDVRIAKTATNQGVFILRTVERETKWASPRPSENASVWTETAHACRLDGMQVPRCEGPTVLATTSAPNPADFDFEQERFFAVDLAPIPWRARKKAVLGPAGELRTD